MQIFTYLGNEISIERSLCLWHFKESVATISGCDRDCGFGLAAVDIPSVGVAGRIAILSTVDSEIISASVSEVLAISIFVIFFLIRLFVG